MGYRVLPGVSADQNTCRSVGRGKRWCFGPPRCWLHMKIQVISIRKAGCDHGVDRQSWNAQRRRRWTPIMDHAQTEQRTGKKNIVTSVKHQSETRRRGGVSHSKLRMAECIEKKKEGDANSLVNFDANQRLMASRFGGAARFFWTQSEFTCWSRPTPLSI